MTLVNIHDFLAVNPEQVTCVSYRASGGVYVELSTGTRHEIMNVTVASIMDLINGVDSQRVTS